MLKSIKTNTLIDSAFPVRSGVANSDILKSYLGLLCLGKNDFDAIENFRDNAFFKRALGLANVPSSPTLRQRLDTHASDWFDLVPQMNQKLLASRINGQPIDFGALACGYTPVDLDTFAMNNSFTKKELVGRTYAGVDGYCPFAVYLGSLGKLCTPAILTDQASLSCSVSSNTRAVSFISVNTSLAASSNVWPRAAA